MKLFLLLNDVIYIKHRSMYHAFSGASTTQPYFPDVRAGLMMQKTALT
jgi:hypothetical protein